MPRGLPFIIGGAAMHRWIIAALAAALCLPAAARAAQSGEDAKVNKWIEQLLKAQDVKKRRLALLDLEIVGVRAKGVLQALQIAVEKDAEPIVRQEVAACLARMGEDAKDAV